MLNARGKRKGADSGEVTPNAAAARPWKRAKKRRRTLCQFMNNMWVILACFSGLSPSHILSPLEKIALVVRA